MRKLFPLILLSLCLTGCGEISVSYKGSRDVSFVGITEEDDPWYGVDYNSKNTDGASEFSTAIRTRGYVSPTGMTGSDPEVFPEGGVYNVTPPSISETDSGTQLFYTKDYGLMLYYGIRAYQFPRDYIVLKTAFIDFDSNGIKDIVVWSYTGKSKGYYYLDFFDASDEHFFNVAKLRYSSKDAFTFLIRDKANNPAVYINDKKVYYVDNQFYCTGVFEYTKPAYYQYLSLYTIPCTMVLDKGTIGL